MDQTPPVHSNTQHAVPNSKNEPTPAKQRSRAIVIFAMLLLVIAVFESLRFFAPVVIQSYNAVKRQRLPDGTMAILEAHSKLRLIPDWHQDENREAWMEGEAFFDVPAVADTNGFIIHTSRFDLVSFQAKLHVVNRDGSVQARLHMGKAYILTQDPKPAMISIAPGDVVEYANGQVTKNPQADPRIIKK